MAVSRKAMTEGIRTSILPGILSSRTFTIPQSQPSVRRLCQLPLHKGAFGCSRTSAFFGNRNPPVTIRNPCLPLGVVLRAAVTDEGNLPLPMGEVPEAERAICTLSVTS